MAIVDLKIMVEDLSGISDKFASTYKEFRDSTTTEKEQTYDKFMDGINSCYEALSELIGVWEVENIKNRVK